MEGLNRLKVYCEAQDLAKFIYRDMVQSFPPEEKYGLTSQVKRAAMSIPANIAEGYGRYYYQETVRFCYLARGSLLELSSHIQLAFDQGYLSDDINLIAGQKLTRVLKLLHGYINYLKESKRGSNEPGAHGISDLQSDYHINGQDENP